MEQQAWEKPGIRVPNTEIEKRVFGDPEDQSRPNPVLVCRIGRYIEGAIFTSIVNSHGLTRFPQRYGDVARSHDPRGDTLLDYSVVTNPDSQVARGLGLFEPLVRSTLTLAQDLGLKHVVAYPRGEFFLGHIRFNPEFDKFESGDGQAELHAIVADLRQRFPNPGFFDLVRAFSFKLPDEKLEEASERYPRWTRSSTRPSPEILGKYFSLNRWNPDLPSFQFKTERDAFNDFADFHFDKVGDRFQGPNHERLGARYMGSIFGSRVDDIRSAFLNVLMCYDVPQSSVSLNS